MSVKPSLGSGFFAKGYNSTLAVAVPSVFTPPDLPRAGMWLLGFLEVNRRDGILALWLRASSIRAVSPQH